MGAQSEDESLDLAADDARLDQLLDPGRLGELLGSFYALFRIPVRLLSEQGASIVQAGQQTPLGELLSRSVAGSERLRQLSADLQELDTGPTGEVSYLAFSGARYHVVAVLHHGRRVGRAVLGPFLPPELVESPKTLLSVDPELDAELLHSSLMQLPRVKSDTARAISEHLALTIDLLVVSGHQQLATERLQLATLHESSRRVAGLEAELAEARGEMNDLRDECWGVLGRFARWLSEFLESSPPDWDRVSAIVRRSQALEPSAWSPKPIDLPALLRAVQGELVAVAGEGGPQLCVHVDGEPPELRADPAVLQQALVQLGESALRSTPPAGRVRFVARSVPEHGGPGGALFAPPARGVEFCVEDDGASLSEEQKRLAVASFAASSDSVGRGRSGLALARAHVEVLGGELRLENGEPTGLTAVIRLPAEHARSTRAARGGARTPPA